MAKALSDKRTAENSANAEHTATTAEAMVAKVDPVSSFERQSDAPDSSPVHEDRHAPAPQHQESIPDSYGLDTIRLMVRDPSWMHSYWDITKERYYQALSALQLRHEEEAATILRVYDVTGSRWGDNGSTDPDSANLFFDIFLDHNARNWYIKVEPDCEYFVEIGLLSPHGAFVSMARSNVVKTPRAGMSNVIDEEWGTVGEQYYNEMYALSGGFDVGHSSLELRQMLEERLRSEIASGGVSSFGGSPVKKQKNDRGFWFVLDTELIVYGATDPKATVTVQGKPVQLRPDGSFTLRFALPDGVQTIDATALSPDKVEERTITPVVSRTTEVPDPVFHKENEEMEAETA